MATGELSTASIRRLKKQRQKERAKSTSINGNGVNDTKPSSNNDIRELPKDIEIEYIPEPIVKVNQEGFYEEFAKVIARFTTVVPSPEETETIKTDQDEFIENDLNQGEDSFDDGDGDGDGNGNVQNANQSKLSKKKLKRQSRMTLAELKQYSRHPEVVEWEDVTAKDPHLLVQLKAVRHSVPTPKHWSQKRKYLSGKRGYVKPPFELPAFIRETGITELRDSMKAQDAAKRIKVKAREKMHPKLGRISVDYERLYDAFFKYQTKPPLTMHGDLYYEGREFEGRQDKKPGYLSEELRAALGMNTHLMPPPWLHNMQKYGPPPAYPHMKVPGLNAPIPEGAQWGYHPGGWGKPPIDNFMRDMPIRTDDPAQLMLLVPVERNLWGELEPDEEVPAEEIPSPELDNPQDLALDEEEVEEYISSTNPTIEYHRENTIDDDSLSHIETPEVIEVRKDRRRK